MGVRSAPKIRFGIFPVVQSTATALAGFFHARVSAGGDAVTPAQNVRNELIMCSARWRHAVKHEDRATESDQMRRINELRDKLLSLGIGK